MKKLVQMHFTTSGPFGAEMSAQFRQLAESINQEPGFLWKIWTENKETGEAGGIYYFSDDASAQRYITMHKARLAQFGIENIHCHVFDVNEPLTALNHGKL